MKLRPLFLPLISVLMTTASQAQYVSETTDPENQGTLTLEQGQPVTLRWANGREAILKTKTLVSPEMDHKFQIVENTCNNNAGVGTRCVSKQQILFSKSFLAWQRHEDPSKIGKAVRKAYNPDDLYENTFSFVSDSRHFFPALAKGMSSLKIVCDDYDWIPQDAKRAKELRIDRIGNELMAENPETNVSENRNVIGALGARYAFDGRRLELKDLRSASTIPFLFIGDVVSWTLHDERGESCEITLKPAGTEALVAQLNKLQAAMPAELDIKDVYLFGSDERSFLQGSGFSLVNELIYWSSLSQEDFE